MTESIPNESEWAEYSAARLKAVWVDFAESPPMQRAQFLKEELARVIKPIPGAYRGPYLERLKMKFPVFAPMAAPAAAGPAGDHTPVETASCEDLMEALQARINTLTPEEKAVLAKKLEPLLPFPKPAPVPVSVSVAASSPTDREALRTALDNFATLDALGWGIWRKIAPPQSNTRRETDLRADVLDFLGGGKSETLPRMKENMAKSRMMIGGLLGAVSGAPIKFASDFCGTFSPDNIIAEVGTNERRCWNKYVELAKQDFPIAAALSFKIQRKMAEFAEEMMRRP